MRGKVSAPCAAWLCRQRRVARKEEYDNSLLAFTHCILRVIQRCRFSGRHWLQQRYRKEPLIMNIMPKQPLVQPEYSGAAKKALSRAPSLFINGEWIESKSGRTIDVIDPSTGKVVSKIADATDQEVDRAVAAAREAFDDGRWTGLPPIARELMIMLKSSRNSKPSTMASRRRRRRRSTFPLPPGCCITWRAGRPSSAVR